MSHSKWQAIAICSSQWMSGQLSNMQLLLSVVGLVCRAQEQVAEQQKQLQTAESVLVDSSNGKLRWAELQQRLLSVIGS